MPYKVFETTIRTDAVASTTSKTCHNQNLRRSHSQVDQQFCNQTTKNTSEIKPKYRANKNKIRKPLLTFIANMKQKQANVISYSHYVSSLACVSRSCQYHVIMYCVLRPHNKTGVVVVKEVINTL